MGVMRELAITNDMAHLPRVRELVSAGIREGGFPAHYTNRLQIAVDEAVTNIIEHGYEDRPRGSAHIWLRLESAPERFAIEVLDEGERFDPRRLSDPDIHSHVDTGHPGGLGVFLMRRIMDVVDYHSEKGQRNRLLLVKHAKTTG